MHCKIAEPFGPARSSLGSYEARNYSYIREWTGHDRFRIGLTGLDPLWNGVG